ncbi:MAG: ATP-binding cassette domain-containing protein, partial [Candidatus Promineifilaceae bacterium]
MTIEIRGAKEHNLKNADLNIGPALTVVTGVSGSGKTSLVFDTLYHEARRRLLDVYALASNAQRLLPANVASISGLGPAVALGQNLLNRNPNSTLATASGLHPFLRLLYARFGERVCSACGTSITVLDQEEVLHKVHALSNAGDVRVMAPLVRNAYGSHKTLLQLLVREFGDERVFLDGAAIMSDVKGSAHSPAVNPDEKHAIDIELADLDSEVEYAEIRHLLGYAEALGATAILAQTDGRAHYLSWASTCPNCGRWFDELEPVHFHTACPECGGDGCDSCQGKGLSPEAASVRVNGLRLPELLELSVDAAWGLFSESDLSHSAERLRGELLARLEALKKVGLGYLTLNRSSPTLSRGEAQRVRLSVILVSRLEDMLHIFDEPTIGQHPADVSRLLKAMRELPGPVVYVEHDPAAAAEADEAVDLGPGAGSEGGWIEFQGSPSELWRSETVTGDYFSGRKKVEIPAARAPAEAFLGFSGANKHNLRDIDVRLPQSRLTVVTGVSGSGKSTLVMQVIAASLTAGEPQGCADLTGSILKPVVVDQKPIGKNPRSNPATYTKLSDVIRDLYSSESGLSPSHFSFNRQEGACPTCKGMGAIEVRMRYMPSTWIPCEACGGKRFSDEICDIRMRFGAESYSINQIYDLPVARVRSLLATLGSGGQSISRRADRILSALCDVGLGYLALGQPSPTLSGGEAQRVKLAKHLGRSGLSSRLLILDEPTTGLHPHDIAGLLVVLDRLVRSGATVLMVEHNLDAIRAADWVIDLGPGAGPQGGDLLYQGPAAHLHEAHQSLTAEALMADANKGIPKQRSRRERRASDVIAIKGASANNLKGVDVEIPKGALTVITGVSGSGKSSLVSDTLEVEARRRYLESLSLYERQGTKEGPEAAVGEINGLGVAMAVGSDRKLLAPRATVGTASEISHHLAVLMTWWGTSRCIRCDGEMEPEQPLDNGIFWRCRSCSYTVLVEPRSFSPSTYHAACVGCSGVGTLQQPNPDKLIRRPDLPLCGGAMYSPGFFPKGFLCKPFNSGYDMVRALGNRYGFDPQTTPWNEMAEDARKAFLFGDPDPMEVFIESRSQSYTRTTKFPGFYGWVRDWDLSGTYSDIVPCPSCHGAKLRPEYLAFTMRGANIHQLGTTALDDLISLLNLDAAIENKTQVRLGDELARNSLQIIQRRLRFLSRVGLGYLHLIQPASTLSAGEAQRITLAGLMGSELTSLTVLLDEPTRGMHPIEVQGLLDALGDMRDEGNTIVVVEHEEQFMRAADYLIDIGPGAGSAGGQIAAQGTPAEVQAAGTITAEWLRGERAFDHRRRRRQPKKWMII